MVASSKAAVVAGVRLSVLEITPEPGGLSVLALGPTATLSSACVTSPRSLEACLREGIDPHELAYRPRELFQKDGLSEEVVQAFHDRYEIKRQRESVQLRMFCSAAVARCLPLPAFVIVPSGHFFGWESQPLSTVVSAASFDLVSSTATPAVTASSLQAATPTIHVLSATMCRPEQ